MAAIFGGSGAVLAVFAVLVYVLEKQRCRERPLRPMDFTIMAECELPSDEIFREFSFEADVDFGQHEDSDGR